MSYIDEIFKRANLQDIREFLFHGFECIEINPKGYKERLSEAQKTVGNKLRKVISEADEYEKFMDDIMGYTSELENVYMEIGLQCGFVLAMQIFKNTGRNEV